jgi:hypothetical protein
VHVDGGGAPWPGLEARRARRAARLKQVLGTDSDAAALPGLPRAALDLLTLPGDAARTVVAPHVDTRATGGGGSVVGGDRRRMDSGCESRSGVRRGALEACNDDELANLVLDEPQPHEEPDGGTQRSEHGQSFGAHAFPPGPSFISSSDSSDSSDAEAPAVAGGKKRYKLGSVFVEGGAVLGEPGGGAPRPQVIFCTRTHSQLSQFVGELRRCPRLASRFAVVALASRKVLCINKQVVSWARLVCHGLSGCVVKCKTAAYGGGRWRDFVEARWASTLPLRCPCRPGLRP